MLPIKRPRSPRPSSRARAARLPRRPKPRVSRQPRKHHTIADRKQSRSRGRHRATSAKPLPAPVLQQAADLSAPRATRASERGPPSTVAPGAQQAVPLTTPSPSYQRTRLYARQDKEGRQGPNATPQPARERLTPARNGATLRGVKSTHVDLDGVLRVVYVRLDGGLGVA